MKMENKPRVFVIMPFNDNFLALYDKLKKDFEGEFVFTNAGDLDNQQNVLQDIVEGIYQADVVIADLTGLNPNVFYELGLAHAMNKKVIIITQDLGELPFDIKSYRANEYSLQFNKIQKLVDELRKLLYGAINNNVTYGNPVSDYIPDFYKNDILLVSGNSIEEMTCLDNDSKENVINNKNDSLDDNGFFDYIAEIEDNSTKITEEISSMCDELNDMNISINASTKEIERSNSQGNNVDANFVRNICRKLSIPIDKFAGNLKGHVTNVSKYWDIVENNYLSLLDTQYAQNQENIDDLKDSMISLKGMQDAIYRSKASIEGVIDKSQVCLGMERRLNKAITTLISELNEYLQMTDTMCSSVDRILSKGEIVIDTLTFQTK